MPRRHAYRGLGPHEYDDGGGGRLIVRPGDEWDEADLPGFGPWELLDDPETAAPTATPPAPPALPPAPPRAATPPPAAAEGK